MSEHEQDRELVGEHEHACDHDHIRNQCINDECFVCGTNNPAGLHAQFVEDEETNELVGIFTGRDEHLSYPGRLHGGVAAAIIDETVGRAYLVRHPGYWGVTMKLELRYRKPTPLGVPLHCRAHITKETHRTFEGEATLGPADGEVCVMGKATYYLCPVEKILHEVGVEGDSYVWDPDPRKIPEGLFE